MKKNLAIVTGSSKGIGKGIVNEFLKDDSWQVLGTSRSGNKELKNNPNFTEIICDLLQPKSIDIIKDQVEEISEEFDSISFIHNFGMTAYYNVLDTPEEEWEKIFKANSTIPFQFTKYLSPLMNEGSSHIFIGSTLSTMAVPNAAAYIASKHALAGLMRATAVDLAPKGIRANLVCPGFTETEMAEKIVHNNAQSCNMDDSNFKSILESKTPLKRFLTINEIGKLVVFLANNPTINGEIIHINGGFGLLN
ncbi:MAG: SDR family oxidoreductase [Candidatus Caenarcaniphilales bacterium]|nr:SDR family oxidoreductase [Candidatus Caenarcaniphilales bacterium]